MNQSSIFQNLFKGVFVVVEGIDCCGKSTQATRIHNWASAYGQIKVAPPTKESTKSHYGQRIRKILGNKELFSLTDPFDLQELFAKDGRLHCQETIIPALQRGELICSDRFRPSMVYGAERGSLADLHALMEMNVHYLGPHFVWPDAIFIFDISVGMAIQRGKKQGRVFDEMENMEILARVNENYHLFAKEYPNCHLIPVVRSDSPEMIFLEVRKILEELLKNKRGS